VAEYKSTISEIDSQRVKEVGYISFLHRNIAKVSTILFYFIKQLFFTEEVL
jgi:hypothetical protein